MGSEIALAVVGKLVEKAVDPIVDTVVRQCSYVFCYKKNIQTLRKHLNDLDTERAGVQKRIDEAGWNLESADATVTSWLEKVDNIIKSHPIAVPDTSNVKKGCLIGWCPNLKHRYMLSREATKLIVDVGELQTEGKQYLQVLHPAPPPGIVRAADPTISHKVDGSEGFASRIATMDEVVDALKDDNINLIGISGMGGVGKTTLVKHVFEKVKKENLFDAVAMAVVSQKPDLIKIQGEIAHMLGLKFEDGSSTVARAVRLCARLENGGSVLVVLDDIWERIDLCEVGIPAGIGCKVKVGFTTRMEDVCIEMEVQRHIKVKMLSQPEAWDLFRKEAGDCVEDEDLCDIAKEVAQECGGLPIAIVTLGKALSKRKKHEWEDTMLKLKQSSGMAGKVKSSIMLSYDFLRSRWPEAQPLLLLCTLFQEDENIQIEWLVKYMMGLDQLSIEVVTLEQTRNRVCTLVDNLKFCNLLLPGDGEYPDLCVRFHDVVRDVCMSIASNPPHAYMVRHVKEMKQWPVHNGHNADHSAIALMSGAMQELPGGLDYPNLRLLQLQIESENINIAGEFFQGTRGLKVFNFDVKRNEYGYGSRCNVTLPPTLGLLTNLQTLSLENCILGGDVSSIGCLKGLKILSFFKSELLVKFQSDVVGELKNLKLLDLRFESDDRRGINIEVSVLSGLDQLEVLYLGRYEFLVSIKELNSLCCLTSLQICISNSMILLQLEEPFFKKLKRFDIFIGDRGGFDNYIGDRGEYGILRNIISVRKDADLSWVSHTKLCSLLRRIQSFDLDGLDEERLMLDERESGFSALYKLESLVIKFMENLREISPDSKIPQGSFHRLQKMYLRGLPALKHLWRGPVQPPSLSKLRDLTISNCDSIESLFSPDVAKCMLELQDLHITCCERLKGVIVSNQGKEGFENIQFPKLESIHLSALPNFKSFYQESGNEDLDGESGAIHTLFNQCVRFHDGIQGFQNLTTLQLLNCDKLRYIMTYSMAKMLVNLQVLIVDYCPEIVGVIGEDEEECSSEAKTNECVVFPQLQELELTGLKRLTAFCSSKCSLEFTLLNNVEIRDCPDMKRFCRGEVKAPMLKEPVEDPNEEDWFWEGNLNNGIYRAKREVEDDDDDEDEVDLMLLKMYIGG